MNAPIENSETTPVPKPSETSKGAFRHAVFLGLVGLVASVISVVAIQATGKFFQLPEELAALTRTIPGLEDQRRVAAGMVIQNYKNYALWVGIAGAITGGLFGLTMGTIHGLPKESVPRALGGVVFGGIFGVAAGYLSNYIGEHVITPVRFDKMMVPEHYSMMLHGLTWLIAGLGIGLGTGLGASRDRCRSALASMLMCGICGAAGGAFFPFFMSAALPLVDASLTIPKGNFDQFLWLAFPSVLMGLGLGRKN